MNRRRLLARSELERRRDYIQQLNGMLGEEHPLVQLVYQCLHNIPDQRPPEGELLQQLEAAKAQVEGPYGQIVKVNLDLEKVRVLREKDTQIRSLQQQMQQVEVGGVHITQVYGVSYNYNIQNNRGPLPKLNCGMVVCGQFLVRAGG